MVHQAPALRQYIFGAPLGITLAVSLAARGLVCGFGGSCKAISLVMLSTLAYFVAFWVAGRLELLRTAAIQLPAFKISPGAFLCSAVYFCWSIRRDIRNLG